MVDSLLQHTMKTQLQQQCNDHNTDTESNPLQEEVSVGQWAITEPQTSQSSSKTLDEIDAELLETEKKRELLLKRHHLTLIQQDNKVLQYMSDIDVMSNNCSEQKNDDSYSEQECASSVASLKQQTEEIIVLMMIKRTLWSEYLSLYYRKTVQEHLDFCCSTETAFLLTFKNYSINKVKILYTMQFLMSESCNIWYHHYATISLKNKSWKYFTQYLLDIVENLVNCQLHSAQVYMKTMQRLNQTVHIFVAHLSILKTQLSLYREDQLMMHLFTKLQPEIRKALFNYQDLSISQESLITLMTHLEGNLHKLFSTQSKKLDDEQSEIIQSQSVHSRIWWVINFMSVKHNMNTASKSSTFMSHSKINSDITCYQCQAKGHYANDCIKSVSNSTINVAAVTQSKNEKVSLKSLHWCNKRQR